MLRETGYAMHFDGRKPLVLGKRGQDTLAMCGILGVMMGLVTLSIFKYV